MVTLLRILAHVVLNITRLQVDEHDSDNSKLKDDQVSWLWGHTNYQSGLTGLTQDDRCSHY